ncbi:PKD domain-containing protein, partial [Patescibacteria group bacterium]
FTAAGVSYPSTANVSAAFSIAWTASDTGGSDIDHSEIWRAPDSGGVPGAWNNIYPNATSPTTENPGDGTWWYGIHALDDASNCITGAGGHCGGVSSDSLDLLRTIREPIKVIYTGAGGNNPPSANNLSVDSPNSDEYCENTAYPPVRVNWTFSDSDVGDSQSAYQIQAVTSTYGFPATTIDTGKLSDSCGGDCVSYVFQSSGERLAWNTNYSWRIMVWDSQDESSSWINGPGINAASQPYPTPAFSWDPEFPEIDQEVQFTDESIAYGGATIVSWNWDLGNGETPSNQNPTTTYALEDSYTVTLGVCDSFGCCCDGNNAAVSEINIGGGDSLPEYQEIPPTFWLRLFFANIRTAFQNIF